MTGADIAWQMFVAGLIAGALSKDPHVDNVELHTDANGQNWLPSMTVTGSGHRARVVVTVEES